MRLLILECEWHGTHSTRFNTQWLQTSTNMRIEVRISLNNLPMSSFRARYHWLSYINHHFNIFQQQHAPIFLTSPASPRRVWWGTWHPSVGAGLRSFVPNPPSGWSSAGAPFQHWKEPQSNKKGAAPIYWTFFMRLPERSHENGVCILLYTIYIYYIYIILYIYKKIKKTEKTNRRSTVPSLN